MGQCTSTPREGDNRFRAALNVLRHGSEYSPVSCAASVAPTETPGPPLETPRASLEITEEPVDVPKPQYTVVFPNKEQATFIKDQFMNFRYSYDDRKWYTKRNIPDIKCESVTAEEMIAKLRGHEHGVMLKYTRPAVKALYLIAIGKRIKIKSETLSDEVATLETELLAIRHDISDESVDALRMLAIKLYDIISKTANKNKSWGDDLDYQTSTAMAANKYIEEYEKRAPLKSEPCELPLVAPCKPPSS